MLSAIETVLAIMAGRAAIDDLDATFNPYSKLNEPQKRDPAKAADHSATKLKPPAVQDLAGSKDSARNAPGKGKIARKNSKVRFQPLS